MLSLFFLFSFLTLSFSFHFSPPNLKYSLRFCSTFSDYESQLKNLNQQLEKAKKESDELVDLISKQEIELKNLESQYGPDIERIKSDFKNIKDRSYREATEQINKAKIESIKEILPIADNFERAQEAFKFSTEDNEKKIIEEYNKMHLEIAQIISDFGIQKVSSLGKPFNCHFMEAVMAQPSNIYAKDIVCQEFQPCYNFGEKCIRPAMVAVSTGPGPK